MDPPPPQLRVLDSVRLSPARHPPASSVPLSGLDADRNVLDISFRTVRFFPPHPVSLDPLDVLQPPGRLRRHARPLLAPRRLPPRRRRRRLLRDRRRRRDPRPRGVRPFGGGRRRGHAGLAAARPPRAARRGRRAGGARAPGHAVRLRRRRARDAGGARALQRRGVHQVPRRRRAVRAWGSAGDFARVGAAESPGPRSPPRVVTPFDAVLATDQDLARRGPYGAAGDGHERLARVWFHVSDARVEALRAQLAADAGLKLTTFEVLAAFIWRARVKANGTSPDEVVKMVYSMNISGLLDPPLPEGYWGNVCVPVYVSLAAGDLVGRPLAETVSLVKKSKRGVDEEYVRSYVDFQDQHRGEGVTAGRGVSAFTDWRRLGHSEVDFGWGGPDAVLPLSWRLLGSVEPCFLLPYGAGDERRRRGFKVFVAMREEAVPRFNEEMEEILVQHEQSD